MSGGQISDVVVPRGADVIVLQRVAHSLHAQVITLLRKKGVAVVIDMDDDLTCIHRNNKAWMNYHPKSNTPYSWRNAEQACRDATLVTVSTAPLLKVYAKHGRGLIIDNYVPQSNLDIAVEQGDAFGWAGTTLSHPADLSVCGRLVQQLVDDGYKFRVIGPKSEVKAQLKLTQEPDYTGIIKIQDWAAETARLKVAMAPLEISPFNNAKSRLKAIEAASVGVPWVASPRQEYRRFHRESGSGLLADTPKDWYKSIKQLMDDEPLRKELGERGREYMRTQTIEANAHLWLDAWTQAYEFEQADKG